MKIVLASKSGVRKEILNKHGVEAIVSPSNVDEDQIENKLTISEIQENLSKMLPESIEIISI